MIFRPSCDRRRQTLASSPVNVPHPPSSRFGAAKTGRTAEHRARAAPGFTRDYGVDRLVFFRGFGEVQDAIRFERQLKRWRRAWKIRLIDEDNPRWADLYLEMMALPPLHPDLRAAMAGGVAVIRAGA